MVPRCGFAYLDKDWGRSTYVSDREYFGCQHMHGSRLTCVSTVVAPGVRLIGTAYSRYV